MKTILDDDKTMEWHKMLKPMTLSYNTNLHQTTKNTPFALTFTFDPSLPYFDMCRPKHNHNKDTSEQFNLTKKAFAMAAKNSKLAVQRQETHHDKAAKQRSFNIGDKVMVLTNKNHPQNVDKNKKFINNYQGPFLIVAKHSDLLYSVAKFPHSKPIKTHVDRLKKFIFTDLFKTNNNDDPITTEIPTETSPQQAEEPSINNEKDENDEAKQDKPNKDRKKPTLKVRFTGNPSPNDKISDLKCHQESGNPAQNNKTGLALPPTWFTKPPNAIPPIKPPPPPPPMPPKPNTKTIQNSPNKPKTTNTIKFMTNMRRQAAEQAKIRRAAATAAQNKTVSESHAAKAPKHTRRRSEDLIRMAPEAKSHTHRRPTGGHHKKTLSAQNKRGTHGDATKRTVDNEQSHERSGINADGPTGSTSKIGKISPHSAIRTAIGTRKTSGVQGQGQKEIEQRKNQRKIPPSSRHILLN